MIRGDRLTLRIEKAVAGGRMLARHDGAIVLVLGAIPGEMVDVEIEKVQRGTGWAITQQVVEASPDRVDPFCDLACGGSVYAHVRYERQLDLKREILQDAFSRLSRIHLPEDLTVVASRPDGYRMRARLHWRDHRLGFFKEGSHELCDAAVTRQLRDDTAAALARLAEALQGADRAHVSEVEISENVAATERVCHLELDRKSVVSSRVSRARLRSRKAASGARCCCLRNRFSSRTHW